VSSLSVPSEATTIVALASPAGPGARGMLRLSGPRAGEFLRAVWGGPEALPDLSRRGLFRGRFRDRRGELPLLVYWMPGPRSFTREDIAELHVPGSPPLVASALERLVELGATPAAPGEFTRRAFLSGRMDLTEAEGVLTLVHAHDRAEARAGAALLFGGLSERIAALRAAFEDLRALCEASLDFDEADAGHVPTPEIESRLDSLERELRLAGAWEARRTDASGAPTIVLVGAPNAGKSSLFNALCGDERALVSDLSGTTRDLVTADIDLGGAAVRLVDGAGFDASARGADHAAQRVMHAAAASADAVLLVVDATRPDPARWASELEALPPDVPAVLVWNQVDAEGARPEPPEPLRRSVRAWASTSARTGAGLDDLRAVLGALLGRGGAEVPGSGLARMLGTRHRLALESALVELTEGREGWRDGAPLEILAEHLRRATARLDQVTGATTPEDILDRIFARFCLGK
jgi:tRNA modification GTPase